MLKLRRGDLWKAVVLLLAIVGVVVFIAYQIRSASAPHSHSLTVPLPQETQAAPSAAEEQATRATGGGMFAPRAHPSAGELAKARTASDPFRPGVSTEKPQAPAQQAAPNLAPSGSQPPTPSASPGRPQLTFAPPKPTTRSAPSGSVELKGIMSGPPPLAVLRAGEQRYFVRQGESLPGGWKVARIGTNDVVLAKDSARVQLTLASP